MAVGLGPDDPSEVGGGRYRLVARLGQGGMGTVYLGRTLAGRAVAVKVIRRELGADPGFRRRFGQEVDAARRVSGFHTAAVVDADASADRPWLVTEYIAAPSLDQVIDRHGPLPEAALYALGAGLAEALAAIHAVGVVHRDLKPSNILLAEDGPRVIDFGIARALDRTQVTLTGYQVGTPGFLAPEQLTGADVTLSVDVFALGVVLCRAAGAAPFGEGPAEAMLYRVVHGEPNLGALPADLRGVVGACLAKDPSSRPTPTEILRRLAAGPDSADSDWLTVPLRTVIDEHREAATALIRTAAGYAGSARTVRTVRTAQAQVGSGEDRPTALASPAPTPATAPPWPSGKRSFDVVGHDSGERLRLGVALSVGLLLGTWGVLLVIMFVSILLRSHEDGGWGTLVFFGVAPLMAGTALSVWGIRRVRARVDGLVLDGRGIHLLTRPLTFRPWTDTAELTVERCRGPWGLSQSHLGLWLVARSPQLQAVPLVPVDRLGEPVDLVLRAAAEIGGVSVSRT
ncbi:serine/threonine-protein kinase [Peterkaempfera bronchialis]|uniref:Serine/threonine protein kinase n=1 Tax=Peterkaempfera bronchialis TaxID=2126346 RepID=A0A345T646_9ACTN|nr:serine/threonine-protein kinase [Peterkaempfera bronchialis]AXI81451.1 serine/threonine protein kinase [Peterkaempfera bronchialis]